MTQTNQQILLKSRPGHAPGTGNFELVESGKRIVKVAEPE